ncbi:MAG: PAS domain-containing protein [Desulfovermiculus sp.]|nr:PAS domain-containing protein [Desulfovermiculus sp.]
MTARQNPFPRLGLSISPWMIIGAAGVLLIVVLALAASNYNREKDYMADILLEKGAALITSFEAGARTGMRHMGWGGSQVQNLLEEMAKHPDVLYLMVVDKQGRILAHNDPQLVNAQVGDWFDLNQLDPTQTAKWRLTWTPDDRPTFEVYKYFNPISSFSGRGGAAPSRRMMGGMMRGNGQSWCAPGNYIQDRQIIFIGFDRTPFIQARQEDLRNTGIILAVLVLLGCAGVVSMYVTRNYRATRRRLQDASAVSQEVIANLPVGLLVLDEQNRVVMQNTAAEAMTGQTAAGIRGRPAPQVLPPALSQLIPTPDSESRIIEQEVKLEAKERGPIALSVSAARIINAAGEFIGSLIILRDLTEIKALQDEVQRKEKLAALGGLAAGIAHEIRNPLSSVKGMATYFKNKLASDPEAREAAEVMVSETNRLNRVISELLEFARPSEIHPVDTNLNTVIEHSLRLIKPDLETRDLILDLHLDPDLPKVSLDTDRFIQSLLNLYLNGIQAMDRSGRLSVNTRPAQDGVEIEVRDNGPGISQEHVQHIFDPYFTTKTAGTGLGLAIVHKIVENHQGRITVRSTPEEGTAFVIWLPASLSANVA